MDAPKATETLYLPYAPVSGAYALVNTAVGMPIHGEFGVVNLFGRREAAERALVRFLRRNPTRAEVTKVGRVYRGQGLSIGKNGGTSK